MQELLALYNAIFDLVGHKQGDSNGMLPSSKVPELETIFILPSIAMVSPLRYTCLHGNLPPSMESLQPHQHSSSSIHGNTTHVILSSSRNERIYYPSLIEQTQLQRECTVPCISILHDKLEEEFDHFILKIGEFPSFSLNYTSRANAVEYIIAAKAPTIPTTDHATLLHSRPLSLICTNNNITVSDSHHVCSQTHLHQRQRIHLIPLPPPPLQ